MRKSDLDKSVEKVIDFKMRAVDALIEEVVKPLRVKDNPEELIGKRIENWTPQDLELLKQIYGTKEPNTLSNFIFNKTYERVMQLESEEITSA